MEISKALATVCALEKTLKVETPWEDNCHNPRHLRKVFWPLVTGSPSMAYRDAVETMATIFNALTPALFLDAS